MNMVLWLVLAIVCGGLFGSVFAYFYTNYMIMLVLNVTERQQSVNGRLIDLIDHNAQLSRGIVEVLTQSTK